LIVLLMGVSGAGKTTVGQRLSQELGWAFADADDFHPVANVEKMTRGTPLTDEDRAPWLAGLRELIVRWIAEGQSGVLACSALKQVYRDELTLGLEVKVVYLKGSPELLRERMGARHGHYMKAGMLESQFAALEEPKDAITVDVSGTVEEVAGEVRKRLGL
jgi:gluconokinase